MEIGVIGAGYVGLTTAACLAEIGHQVTCAENDPAKLDLLRAGKVPFFEPHLSDLVTKNRAAGRLKFTLQTEQAVDQGVAIFICVGTPPLENGEADLSAIERVAHTIAQHASGYRLIIEKSTVPVRTGRRLQHHLGLYKSNHEFSYDVASNPEFLREASAVEDFLHPDRIVVGVETPAAADMLKEIYEPVLLQSFPCPVHPSCPRRSPVPWVVTNIEAAELIKHAANSFLAMKISFINMVADLCEAVGTDIDQVAHGIGLDPRIGPSFLRPGIGFGGFCFPKDLQAFFRIGETFGCDFSLLREVERINAQRVDRLVKTIKEELWVLRGKRIGVWGLAFKPGTDDIRFAPAVAIIRRLLAEGASVQAYDPEAMAKCRVELPDVRYCRDAYEVADGADAILILTEWSDFRQVDLERVRKLVARPLIIDGRNLLSKDQVIARGFQYIGIGRRTSAPLGVIGLKSAR